MKILTYILLLLCCCSCSKKASLQDLPKQPISLNEASFYLDGGSIGISGVDGNGKAFEICFYNSLEAKPDLRPYLIIGTTLPEPPKGLVVKAESIEEKALITILKEWRISNNIPDTVESDKVDAVDVILKTIK